MSAALTYGYFIISSLGGNCNSHPLGKIHMTIPDFPFPHLVLINFHYSSLLFSWSSFLSPPCPGLDLPPCHIWQVLAQVLSPGKLDAPGKINPAAKSCGQ